MRICYLTQTANDISEEYKEFFKDKNFFFITFKSPNPNAIAFVSKSTWADGRNKLWGELKDQYDYYVFIDDDLRFYHYKPKFSFSPFLSNLFYRYNKSRLNKCYERSIPEQFFTRLENCLQEYKPEVAAVTKVDGDPNSALNGTFIEENTFIRRVAYFDAQFTVLSNYAASKILPYDTKISGWWSAQIPVFLYAFHVFGRKAINIIDLGVSNVFSTGGKYVAAYDGYLDCEIMLKEISKFTHKDYTTLVGPVRKGTPINDAYGSEAIRNVKIKPTDVEDYKRNFNDSLKGIEEFLHNNMMP